MKKMTAALGLILSLAACADDLPPAAPIASHSLPPKISLDVEAINLADRSGIQPPNSPYNDNHFSPTINDAIKQWASDRLQAVGQTGQAIVLIKDASLTAQPIAKKDSWFTREQAIKYTGHAEVSVEANGREGFATAEASATRMVTLPENPTATEKQDAYYSLLNGLMKDLGQNLDSAIQTHMNSFIMPSPIVGTMAVPAMSASSNSPMMSDDQPIVSGMTSDHPLSAPGMSPPGMAAAADLPPAPPTPPPVASPVQGQAIPRSMQQDLNSRQGESMYTQPVPVVQGSSMQGQGIPNSSMSGQATIPLSGPGK